MKNSYIAFRTEASHKVGFGHLMRCIALAEEAIYRNIQTVFILDQLDSIALEKVKPYASKILKSPHLIGSIYDAFYLINLDINIASFFIDSYKINEDYIDILSKKFKLIVIDDLCNLNYYNSDFVINPSVSANKLVYKSQNIDFKLLLGPQYALIRSEFLEYRRKNYKNFETKKNIALTFGGSDPYGFTYKILQNILNFFSFNVTINVIIGPGFNLDYTNKIIDLGNKPNVECFLNPKNIAKILSEQDLVITGGGGTIGELATLGCAAVVIIVSDNQILSIDSSVYPVFDGRLMLTEEFYSEILFILTNKYIIRKLSFDALNIVDGLGCKRILDII